LILSCFGFVGLADLVCLVMVCIYVTRRVSLWFLLAAVDIYSILLSLFVVVGLGGRVGLDC